MDSHYVAGKRNVLFAAETTNTIYFDNETTANCIAQATAYLTRVRSAHPDWVILLAGSLPAGDGFGFSDVAERNARLIAVDDYMAANYLAMGADWYVGYRDLPQFSGNGVTTPYSTYPTFWFDKVHPTDAGKVAMRKRVVQGLLALPASH